MNITDKEISDVDRAHRDANIMAMRSTGWRRRIHLAFARFFSWAGDIGRKIQRDEQRGKDDSYHDQY